MDKEKSENDKEQDIDKKNFRKLFFHLCAAAKKQEKQKRKDKAFREFEKKAISEKIDEVEKNQSLEKPSWIKDRLSPVERKIVVVKEKTKENKKAEIEEIKKQIAEIKKSYELLKKNKKTDKKKIKAVKEKIEMLEKILKKQ